MADIDTNRFVNNAAFYVLLFALVILGFYGLTHLEPAEIKSAIFRWGWIPVVIASFLLIREALCWYWKINKIVETLERIAIALEPSSNDEPDIESPVIKPTGHTHEM